MKKQALRADEVAARWRLKRDDVQKQLDEAGEVMAAKDATIAQHKRLMKEYQSVLEASRDPPPPEPAQLLRTSTYPSGLWAAARGAVSFVRGPCRCSSGRAGLILRSAASRRRREGRARPPRRSFVTSHHMLYLPLDYLFAYVHEQAPERARSCSAERRARRTSRDRVAVRARG